MKLNPCKNCGDIADVRIDSTDVFCITLDCRNQVEYDGRLQNAITAWNEANPVVGQVDALEALQQALAWALMYRYGSNRAIWRDDIKLGYDRDCVDLLITQGVLIETDGRITIK